MSARSEQTDFSGPIREDSLRAAARCRLYALFAEAFAYPSAAWVARFASGAYLADLHEAAGAAPGSIEIPARLEGPSGPDPLEAMRVTYTGLFDVCGGRPRVSLLERRYRTRREPEQALWEDLLRFYRHFGLDFSAGSTEENPDHLLLQLDFMQYLAFLEAKAGQSTDDLRRGQRDFLTGHLGQWAGVFSEALAEQDEAGPYPALAKAVASAVTADIAYLEGLVGEAEPWEAPNTAPTQAPVFVKRKNAQ